MSDLAVRDPMAPSAEVVEGYKAVAALADQYRRAIGQVRTLKLAVLSLGVATMALAGGFLIEAARSDVVPVFIWMHRDGTVDTSESLSRLPTSTHEAGIEAELWAYVWHREHYNYDDARADYLIISAMSAPDVRKQYQDQANPRNPDALVNREGRAVTMDADLVTGDYYERTSDFSAGVYHVRYKLFTHHEGKADLCQRMAVTVRYAPMETVPLLQRRTFNPHGIIILDYPKPQLESVLPTKDCQ
jgi:type IV secretion system protein VirB8